MTRHRSSATRLRATFTVVVVLGVLASVVDGAVTAPAGAAGVVVTNYTDASISHPNSITEGPDGALWFVNSNGSIGRITTAGVVTNYTNPGATEITAGPDGALWFTYNPGVGGSIGRITTSGVVTNFTDPSISRPVGITAGPDGALWFVNRGNGSTLAGESIGRITTAGVVTNYTDPSINQPLAITPGPDGALWFTNTPVFGKGSIGRITTAGVVTNYTDPSINQPSEIAPGPDCALWFGNAGSNSIGRITTPLCSLHITTVSLAQATVKVPYSATLTASGGNPPYKWSLVSGSLPKELNLKESTGVISGKPDKKDRGTYIFTVKVVDTKIKTKHGPATQNTATKVLSITIS